MNSTTLVVVSVQFGQLSIHGYTTITSIDPEYFYHNKLKFYTLNSNLSFLPPVKPLVLIHCSTDCPYALTYCKYLIYVKSDIIMILWCLVYFT